MIKLFIVLITTTIIANEIITPLPKEVHDYELNKALLGKALFEDKRLSQDNTISCSSCHNTKEGGDDNRKLSIGINNSIGLVNTPTVLNSRFNFVQFWDGRSGTLKEQASGPIHNPIEMNSNFKEIIIKLSNDSFYVSKFKEIYNSSIKEEHIINAIVEYEKALITPNSKFDKYLNGDKNILTYEEKKGFELFKEFGCISCHNGVNIGGNLFQKVGIMEQYFPEEKQHFGRYNITQNPEDKFYFKVPSLRNVELTAPYLHDGSANDLKSVIDVMLKYQIGTIYNEQDIKYIEKFLLTLTGENPKIDRENF